MLESYLALFAIMLTAGSFGGYLGYLTEKDGATSDTTTTFPKSPWPKHILSGVGASLLVPLFLKLTDSRLLPQGETQETIDFYIFASLCVLAGISSKSFISSLSQKALMLAREAQQEAVKNKAQVQQISDQQQVVEQKIDQAKELVSTPRIAMIAEAVKDSKSVTKSRIELDDDIWNSDPHKGQFGGSNEANGRKLTAKIRKDGENYYRVDLKVESTDPQKPLAGNVMFFYHPTFTPNEETVKVENGIATTYLWTVESFTVGVTTDNGATRLELDLAEVTSRPPDFV